MFARIFRSVISDYANDEEEIESEVRDLWTALSKSRAG
jgi:hypothetical protein